MTESNPEATPPETPSTPTPAPAPSTEGKRYAAYDETFKRYVGGGTHDTRKAAAQAAKDRNVKSFKVREV